MTEGFAVDRAAFAAGQWRRERPDLDPFPMELVGRLLEAAQIIATEHLGPFFRKAGLKSGEFDVLATLQRSGAPYMLTPTDLYEALMISSGGMTARLDRLEEAGWIERKAHPSDRRGSLVAMTEAGRDLMDEILPLHVANEAALLSCLDRKKQVALNESLRDLLVGLQRGVVRGPHRQDPQEPRIPVPAR